MSETIANKNSPFLYGLHGKQKQIADKIVTSITMIEEEIKNLKIHPNCSHAESFKFTKYMESKTYLLEAWKSLRETK